ncbi:MAG: DsbA family oxidoreductase, partial [Polaromonas sp.]|nr:DsbA family oxidoreductase [Polaromonas sp.]
MTTQLKIDFVSDVSCPWCVIGLKALDQALARVGSDITAELHFQPFELNPGMGAEGQEITEHITQKYGITPAQAQANRENIRVRGAELGFKFSMAHEPGGGRHRIYNTFDAHRLLHWAELEGADQQKALKEALFKAYFTDGQSLASHEVLARVASEVGLDAVRAREILASSAYADEVREREQFYLTQGIHSVPA